MKQTTMRCQQQDLPRTSLERVDGIKFLLQYDVVDGKLSLPLLDVLMAFDDSKEEELTVKEGVEIEKKFMEWVKPQLANIFDEYVNTFYEV